MGTVISTRTLEDGSIEADVAPDLEFLPGAFGVPSTDFMVPELVMRRMLEESRTWYSLGPQRPPVKVSRRRRLSIRWMAFRERVGYWIAGHEPPDDDW